MTTSVVSMLFLLICLACCSPQASLADPAGQREIPRAPSPNVTAEVEDILLDLLNRERAKHGRPRLSLDPQLKKIARLHSLHMAKRGLLSHVDSLGEGPTERAKKIGIQTVKRSGNSMRIGIIENVGFMPTGNVRNHGLVRSPRDVAAAMVDEWMQSPSHRDNILNPEVSHAGIGAASDAQNAFYLTMDVR